MDREGMGKIKRGWAVYDRVILGLGELWSLQLLYVRA